MFKEDFQKLQFVQAPENFLKAVKSTNINEF